MVIQADGLSFKLLNEKIMSAGGGRCEIKGCLGQRFIAAGMSNRNIIIDGIPGNGLGAYLNGSVIRVRGNAQDAVGDTMNDGTIIVEGNIGDALGYAMRGGEIYVKGDAGYRAGIHMKEYRDKIPHLVVGGSVGSFCGEYQAGGIILVLGLGGKRIVGNFPCTGMYGGKMFLRTSGKGLGFPSQVAVAPSNGEERKEIETLVEKYCRYFNLDFAEIMDSPYITVRPNSSNPYQKMYVAN